MKTKPTLTSSFADILQTPGMKKMLEDATIQDAAKALIFSGALQMWIQTAIEVVSVDEGHGNAYQEAGHRHWVPGVFAVADDPGDQDEFTACRVRITGMVRDRAKPEKLTCDDCAAHFAAMRLRQEP